jgi:hypothetical protein
MAGERKLRKGEVKFVESALALGAVIGLVDAIGFRSAAGSCRGGTGECVGASMAAVMKPYVLHGTIGAMVAAALAVVLVYTWRWRNAGRPVAAPAPRREAIPQRVRHEVWRRDRGSCVECGSRGRLEFDHIIPVSRGGSNTTRNIELRCEPCNRRKGARV